MSSFDQPHQWILVRGLAREQRHWGGFPAQIRAKFPKGRVLTLDLAGVGARSHLPSPRSIAAMAVDLRAEFQKHSDGTPAFMLSPSLGGMVMLEWLNQDATGIAGAVLINTSIKGLNPFWERMQMGALFRLAASVFVRSAEAKERLVLSVVSNHEAGRVAALPLWTKLRAESPIATRVAITQIYAAMTHEVSFPKDPPPVLIMRGMQDKLAHPRCSETLSKRIRSRLVDHPTGGHDLPMDDPEWILDQIGSWAGQHA